MTIKQNVFPFNFSFHRLFIVFLSLHLLAFSGLAQSASVFMQPPLDGGDGVDAFTPEEYADDFLLISNTRVTGIQWWGSFINATTASTADNVFDIHFYGDNNGIPGILLNSFLNVTATRNTSSLLDIVSETVFRFDALSLTPFGLLANQRYYVSILHVDQNDQYFWLQSDSAGAYFNQNSSANISWNEVTGNNNLAFNLVPEPATPVLFSIALLSAAFHRRSVKIQGATLPCGVKM